MSIHVGKKILQSHLKLIQNNAKYAKCTGLRNVAFQNTFSRDTSSLQLRRNEGFAARTTNTATFVQPLQLRPASTASTGTGHHRSQATSRLLKPVYTVVQPRLCSTDTKSEQEFYLIILNLDPTANAIALSRKLMEHFPTATRIYVPANGKSGKCRGFARMYLNKDDAETILATDSYKHFDGRQLTIEIPYEDVSRVLMVEGFTDVESQGTLTKDLANHFPTAQEIKVTKKFDNYKADVVFADREAADAVFRDPSYEAFHASQLLIMKRPKREDGTRIYVGHLAMNVDRIDMLRNLMKHFPNAEYAHMPMQQNGLAQSYAFVTLASEEDVDEILSNQSYSTFDGRQITFGKSQSTGERPALYIGNLDREQSWQDAKNSLQQHFPKSMEIYVPSNDQDTVLGYAFVKFNNVEEADEVLNDPAYCTFFGRQLEIREPRKQTSSPGPAHEKYELYVGGLDQTVQSQQLISALKRHFSTASFIRVPANEDGCAKGYAFATFHNKQAYYEVLANPAYAVFNDQQLVINEARGSSPRTSINKRTSLYVTNLGSRFHADELRDRLMRHFPSAKGAVVPSHADGWVKGFAFVDFGTEEVAEEILSDDSYLDFDGQRLIIQTPHQDNQHQQEEQRNEMN